MNGAVLALFSLLSSAYAFTLPAGLRPAKAVGDARTAIVPGQDEAQPTAPSEVGSNKADSREISAKVPPNLSLRSRMMAALSSRDSSKTAVKQPIVYPSVTFQVIFFIRNLQDERITSESDAQVVPPSQPIIFTKNHKKGSPAVPKPIFVDTSRNNVLVVAKAPGKPSANNYGLNTVLQTNLVDSRGRVMKGVNVVPIKVQVPNNPKNGRIRYDSGTFAHSHFLVPTVHSFLTSCCGKAQVI
ncbi:unnamed protein product [Anisakis simplex]|uniref:Secreted protein n=1 Tax=Anisakis simplex TaxID=6269 RepID=A0A158PMY4_ANISI|nr:unnamed protein product [Anisakis simplex]